MKPFVFALLLAGAASAAQTFQVPGCTATSPAAINDLNEVVGTATCGGLATAFIRDPAGHFTTFTVKGQPTTAPTEDSEQPVQCAFGGARATAISPAGVFPARLRSSSH